MGAKRESYNRVGCRLYCCTVKPKQFQKKTVPSSYAVINCNFAHACSGADSVCKPTSTNSAAYAPTDSWYSSAADAEDGDSPNNPGRSCGWVKAICCSADADCYATSRHKTISH